MKQKLGFAAIALGLLASCSEAEIIERSDSKIISFDTYIGKGSETRGVPVADFVDGNAMQVFGVTTDTKLGAGWAGTGIPGMIPEDGGSIYTKTSSNWSGNSISYWEENKFHSFFAYAPATTSNTSLFNNGIVTYTVADELANQIDFMVADPVKQDLYTTGTPSAVTFTFRHMLSQVRFKVIYKENYANNTFKLEDNVIANSVVISLNNGINNTFVKTGSVNVIGKTDTEAWNVINNTTGAVASYTVTPDNSISIPFTYYKKGVNQEESITFNGGANDHILMLMPQTTDGKLKIDLELSYRYTYTTPEDKKENIIANFITSGPQTWEANKIYTYVLVLDMVNVLDRKPIVIANPTIVGWDEDNIVEQEFPAQP